MHGAAALLCRKRDIAFPDIPGPRAFSLSLRGWSYSTLFTNILAMQASLCVSFSLGSPFTSCFAAAQGARPAPNKNPTSSLNESTKTRDSFWLYRMGEAALEGPLQSGDQRRGAFSAGGSAPADCRPGDLRHRRLWIPAAAAETFGKIRRAGGMYCSSAGHLDGEPFGHGRAGGTRRRSFDRRTHVRSTSFRRGISGRKDPALPAQIRIGISVGPAGSGAQYFGAHSADRNHQPAQSQRGAHN